ncbi:MAG: hypothetical protein LCH84_08875 [Gemmatimonadetes bacterium]|nr:hypothetical protein [Gemmatimonadota bacterium]
MACRLLLAGVVAGASAWPTATQAQPAAARLDTAALRTLTLGDLLDSARVADSLAAVAPAVRAKRVELTQRLTRAEVQSQRLWALGDAHVGFVTVARRRYAALSTAEAAALDTLAAILEEEVRTPLDAAVGRTRAVPLMAPVDAFNAGRRSRSMLDSREKLARFERKYGPDAPTRNGAEVALNFAAQFVPGFRANRDEWPSRAELIASYVPTYLAVPRDGGKTSAVTAAEAGVRLYIWRDGWGGKSGGALRPGFVSFGLLAAGARDGAFVSPFSGQSRIGGFVGWGAAKIGVIGGRDTRVLITRQVQLVPWVF